MPTDGVQAMIKVKRAYDSVEAEDGIRFLVDRLWPRGIGKDKITYDFFRTFDLSFSREGWYKQEERDL